jgi:hypothetical protein
VGSRTVSPAAGGSASGEFGLYIVAKTQHLQKISNLIKKVSQE